jgi:hypothetical protein
LEKVTGKEALVEHAEPLPGDIRNFDIGPLALEALGYSIQKRGFNAL